MGIVGTMSEEILLDEYEGGSIYIEEGYLDDSVLVYHESKKPAKCQMCMWYLRYRLLKFLRIA